MLKKLLARLKHKYGPLPLWAWTAIAGAGVYLWNRTRRSPSEEEAAAPAFSPAYAFGEGEADYGDTGGGPAPVGEVGPVEGGGELYPDNKLREASMDLIDQIRGISDELGERGPATGGSEDVVEPDSTEDVGGDREQPEAGVRWGGQTFTTKAALGRWLAEHYAGRGQAARAYKDWARNHPDAAAKLSGPAPKPPKKQPPKAPKRPSARTQGREPAKGGRGAAGARARAPQPPAARAERPRPAPARRQAPQPAPKPKPKPTPKRSIVARVRARRA